MRPIGIMMLGKLRKQPRGVRPADLCPADGSTATLLQKAAAVTGRPITVIEKPLPSGGPSGVWVWLPDKDLVVLDTQGTLMRRDAALCHEIGHIVLGHSPSEGDTAALFPDLDPALVAALLGNSAEDRSGGQAMMFRCTYEDRQELEAERFATELLSALIDSRNTAISHAYNRFR